MSCDNCGHRTEGKLIPVYDFRGRRVIAHVCERCSLKLTRSSAATERLVRRRHAA